MIRIPKGAGWPILTPRDTPAFDHVADAYPMPSVALGLPPVSDGLYHGYEDVDVVPAELYEKYDVKRGLRNADGSGVLVGLTTISNVHGYNRTEHGIEPDDGQLIYRGYGVDQLINAAQADDRFGYEEVAYLLISGRLPTRDELDDFRARIDARKQLPEGYLGIFPRATYSHSIMNVLQRATLLLYAFDPTPDDTSPTHEIDVALSLLGRWPRTAAVAHAAHVAEQNDTKLMVPPVREGYSMAETVLDVLRSDEGFSHEEAMLLDVMLVLHAEHGGGNNSTFTTRVLSSSGTDAYSAYAAAIGSLKGPKHGGANYKANDMIEDVAAHVRDWSNDDEVADYLGKILRKEAFDKAGLLYGLGHAVYTKTDPRAEIIRSYARKLAEQKGQVEKLDLIASIERLGPQVMRDVRGITKSISTNIDMYTGFVYSMLGIPQDLYTPIFAMARLAGWTAHRMEELYGAGRIIRPAYNSVMPNSEGYVPLDER
ncbi:citrate synthase [Thermophilibacter sp. ET337]|uniref:citrate synthase n=1 Tax=Thermophilibacter sp. ET337 TaxID=2973084 RepID=UPI0021AC282D|nr:citrate synthase [Thermophilibacter sp. ET337]MCR8907008.1 citrate synthase [Thermophilibacter sp. ET337]